MFIKYVLNKIYSRYAASLRSNYFPVTLDIELTNNCNLDCVMCSRRLMKRKVGYMDIQLFKKIIDDIKPYPPRFIGLHLFGEPLMHPDLIKIIPYIKNILVGTRVFLSTNACLLNNQLSEGIIGSGLDMIRFSLDGAIAKTYEDIRLGANFKQVRSHIKEFIEIRKKMNSIRPLIQVQMLGMNTTLLQILRFKKYWKPLLTKDDQVIIQEVMTFAGRVRDFSPFKIATFRDRIKRRLPCLRLWKNLVIYWDGRVTACCYDYDGELFVGDINKESIRQIWNGPRINALRQAQLNMDKSRFSLCRSCIKQKV